MNPEKKLRRNVLTGITVTWVLLCLAVSACKKPVVDEKMENVTKKAVQATGVDASMLTIKLIKKSDFGANWPFMPDSGLLIVTPIHGIFFMDSEDNIYAVNGTARNELEENSLLHDLTFSSLHRKETNKDSYVDLYPVINYGLCLVDPQHPITSYYAPEPPKEPDVKWGLTEAQRRQIFQENWDGQYYAKLKIAKRFLYKEHSSLQGDLEDVEFHKLNKRITEKHHLDDETYGNIITDGISRGWRTEKSFSYSWQLTNSFPE